MEPSDNCLIPPQTQMRVKDSNFEISVYTWDEFTLDLLKKYADWKCNNGNKISNENNISKINNTNNIDNGINVKNNIEDINQCNPACKQCNSNNVIKNGTRKNKSEIVNRYLCKECGHRFTDDGDDEVLATYSSDYGSPVHKSIVDEILSNLGKSFSRNDVADIIYKKRNGEVTKNTCCVYSKDYINYLTKNNLIIEKNGKFYKIHTESETDWTASDEEYLRENFFLISLEKLSGALNKTPKEIKEKAIRFFGKKAVIKRYGE